PSYNCGPAGGHATFALRAPPCRSPRHEEGRMNRRIAIAGICTGMLVMLSAVAAASVLCLPQSGVGPIRARPKCLSTAAQLRPDAAGMRGRGALVIDATGASVGPIEGGVVLLQTGNTAVTVLVDSVGLVQPDSFYRYYESTDCTGPAFSNQDNPRPNQLI